MAEQPYASPEPLEMITAIVHRGKAQKIAHAAIEAGAHAVTVHFARGLSASEKLHFFGLAIHSEKEIIFTVVSAAIADEVYEAMVEAGNLHEHGTGFIFAQDVRRATGWVSATLKED